MGVSSIFQDFLEFSMIFSLATLCVAGNYHPLLQFNKAQLAVQYALMPSFLWFSAAFGLAFSYFFYERYKVTIKLEIKIQNFLVFSRIFQYFLGFPKISQEILENTRNNRKSQEILGNSRKYWEIFIFSLTTLVTITALQSSCIVNIIFSCFQHCCTCSLDTFQAFVFTILPHQ